MINRAVLVGRLTKDPELKYTPNGVAVANFTLAVNRPFKNQQGENDADFIRCTVWRKIAENTATYLGKGSMAGVEGRIQTRQFENDEGKRVTMVEVQAENVQFLDTRNGSGNKQQGQQGQQKQQGENNQSSDPFADNGQPIDISDDDLPF